ncbi:MAG: RNA polymerase sigma factor [Planctomycetota bacterium]
MAVVPNTNPEDPVPALRLAGSDVDDVVLVRQLKDGDPHAAEQLIERYAGPLGGYLRRVGGSEHAAEELMQATWLSVLEHLDRFDADAKDANFKAWLFRIASNKAYDGHRRTKRDRNAQAHLRLVSDMAHADDARTKIEYGETADRLKAAIDDLPDAQKQVVMLRYYSGLKFVEIADMLGCPLNTALGRMHKAIKKLRGALEGLDT